MLFVHDRGQMCNNILQFGHLYAWCREHQRHAVSVRFAYKYQYFRICRTRWHRFWVYAMAKTAARLHLIPTLDFDQHQLADEAAMSRLLLECGKTIWVDGWHVHFNTLFQKYRDEICSLFAFLPEVEQVAADLLRPWDDSDRCLRLGLHVRRGDYARFLGGRYFYDDATLQRLLREFQEMMPQKQLVIVVCGNDPALDREAYRRAVPQAEFLFAQGNPGEDLCLLSHCDYLLGAPSTFSLVASMYRDLPLCWIPSCDHRLSAASFQHFDTWLRQIDTVFR